MPRAAGLLTGILILAGCGGRWQEKTEKETDNRNIEIQSLYVLAQADYPKDPVYKNDEERWEARVGKVIPDQFQTAYGRFVYQTASALLCENLEDNVIYSPVGLYYALSMAA